MNCLEKNLRGLRGSYVLFVCCRSSVSICTRHRFFLVEKGLYAYVGSGMGPGGVFTRIKRHACVLGKPFWHIDYLLRSGCTAVGFVVLPGVNEKDVASALSSMHEYVVGFGCSDDPSSPSHLFVVKDIFGVCSFLARRGLRISMGVMLGDCS